MFSHTRTTLPCFTTDHWGRPPRATRTATLPTIVSCVESKENLRLYRKTEAISGLHQLLAQALHDHLLLEKEKLRTLVEYICQRLELNKQYLTSAPEHQQDLISEHQKLRSDQQSEHQQSGPDQQLTYEQKHKLLELNQQHLLSEQRPQNQS
ncbi:hypothetical protein V6N12_057359 [Hibiscus sabdariffa]|uniref:Uncharacterized protein n=1 Tax=Hibiscus sabdariffa TaxID=183260 RepID=A0ABR2DBP1_9ROSI